MTHLDRQAYDSLTALLEGFRQLKRLVMQERDDVTSLDLAGLESRSSEIESCFSHVRALSEQAAGHVAAACGARGAAENTGLTGLAAATPRPERDHLKKLQAAIKEESSAVENALKVNRALLEDSQAFTAQTLQMFTSILKSSSSTTYGQQGRFIETTGQPRIICKEI